MTKRVTIVLDDNLVKKLSQFQARMIKDSVKSVSFSSVLNKELRKNLEK